MVRQARHRRRHRIALVALASVVGVATASGIALATIPDSSGVIHGCYKKSGGTMRVIDDAVTNCASSETSVNWNVSGQQGPPGPPGISGHEIETGTPTADDSTDIKDASVDCPAGKKVLGGGWRAEGLGAAGVAGMLSAPSDADSWVVRAGEFLPNASNWSLQAWAICATVAP